MQLLLLFLKEVCFYTWILDLGMTYMIGATFIAWEFDESKEDMITKEQIHYPRFYWTYLIEVKQKIRKK